MDNAGQILLLIVVFACVLPLIIMVVLAVALLWFGRRYLENIASPDITPLLAEYHAAVAKSPESRDAMVHKIIRRQAFRCAVVGFVTGFGGFFTLPVALPVDVLVSVRLQAAMIKFIATVYGYEAAYDSKVATYMIMSGSAELTDMSVSFLMRVLVRLIGESFSRFVPFLGAVMGALVNYFLARFTGQLAVRWYAHRGQPPLPATI